MTKIMPNATAVGVPAPTPQEVTVSPATISVSEEAGTVTATCTRTGPAQGALQLAYTLTAITAVEGTDYTDKSGTFDWADGITGDDTDTITILDNPAEQGDVTFKLVVTKNSGADTIVNDTLTVTVLDQDNTQPWPKNYPLSIATTSHGNRVEWWTNEPYRTNIGRGDLTIHQSLGMYVEAERDATKAYIDSVHTEFGALTKVINYTQRNGLPKNRPPNTSEHRGKYDKIVSGDANAWFYKDRDGQRLTSHFLRGARGEQWKANISAGCPLVGGENYNTWVAEYYRENFDDDSGAGANAVGEAIDGFYHDVAQQRIQFMYTAKLQGTVGTVTSQTELTLTVTSGSAADKSAVEAYSQNSKTITFAPSAARGGVERFTSYNATTDVIVLSRAPEITVTVGMPFTIFINSITATSSLDHDVDGDNTLGIQDAEAALSHRQGMLDWWGIMETNYPSHSCRWMNAGNWLGSSAFESSLSPPQNGTMPNLWTGEVEGTMLEDWANQSRLQKNSAEDGYEFRTNTDITRLYQDIEVSRNQYMADGSTTFGRAYGICEIRTNGEVTDGAGDYTATTIAYVRFFSICAWLSDQTMPAPSPKQGNSSKEPMSLDEGYVDIGDTWTSAEIVSAVDVDAGTMTLRAADWGTMGYWRTSERGIIIGNLRLPTGSTQAYDPLQAGGSAAYGSQTCSLPDPGTGRHWEFIDANATTGTKNTKFASDSPHYSLTGQDTTTNKGGAVPGAGHGEVTLGDGEGIMLLNVAD